MALTYTVSRYIHGKKVYHTMYTGRRADCLRFYALLDAAGDKNDWKMEPSMVDTLQSLCGRVFMLFLSREAMETGNVQTFKGREVWLATRIMKLSHDGEIPDVIRDYLLDEWVQL